MGRFAILVDAGYLLAASGTLLFDVADRRALVPCYPLIVATLVELAFKDCGKEHLRTYWYDGARDLRPTPQHLTIAGLPGVKLRLGRVTHEGQKGVDSRIVRDLIVLSVERAISDAYLVGGDEDLREGVSEAQERGVRVVLVGVEQGGGRGLSSTLAMEADRIITLEASVLRPLFRLGPAEVGPSGQTDATDLRSLGSTWADAFLERLDARVRASLMDQRTHVIPGDIDQQLLAFATRTTGVARLDKAERAALREGFWAAVRAAAGH